MKATDGLKISVDDELAKFQTGGEHAELGLAILSGEAVVAVKKAYQSQWFYAAIYTLEMASKPYYHSIVVHTDDSYTQCLNALKILTNNIRQ